MPKQTFFNLSSEKKRKVYETLVSRFKQKAVKDVTVKEIITDLNIPRGSFYQYFESINEAYFYVLQQELVEVHDSLLNLVREKGLTIVKVLDFFGEVVAEEIFSEKNYPLYKSRYLYLDSELEKQWKLYRRRNTKIDHLKIPTADREKIAFVGAVIHSLIKRLFVESWDRKAFLEHYRLHINWVKGGILA